MAYTIEQGDIDLAKGVAQIASAGIRASNEAYIRFKKPNQTEAWYDRIAVASNNDALRLVVELAASKLPVLARWTSHKSYVDDALGAIDSSKLQGIRFTAVENFVIDRATFNKKTIIEWALVGLTGRIAKDIILNPVRPTNVLIDMQLIPGTIVVPSEDIVNPERKPRLLEVVAIPKMDGKFKAGELRVIERPGSGRETLYDPLSNGSIGFVVGQDALRVLSESQFRAVRCLPLFIKAMQNNLPEYRKRD